MRAALRRWCQNAGCGLSAQGRSAARARNALCSWCSKADSVLVHGAWQRFCQACKNIHSLDHFRGQKSSCETALQKTRNARQRAQASLSRSRSSTSATIPGDLSESEHASKESSTHFSDDSSEHDAGRSRNDHQKSDDDAPVPMEGAPGEISAYEVCAASRTCHRSSSWSLLAPVDEDADDYDMGNELVQGTTSAEQTIADEANAIGMVDIALGPAHSSRQRSPVYFSNGNASSAELDMQHLFQGEDLSSVLLDSLVSDDPNMV